MSSCSYTALFTQNSEVICTGGNGYYFYKIHWRKANYLSVASWMCGRIETEDGLPGSVQKILHPRGDSFFQAFHFLSPDKNVWCSHRIGEYFLSSWGSTNIKTAPLAKASVSSWGFLSKLFKKNNIYIVLHVNFIPLDHCNPLCYSSLSSSLEVLCKTGLSLFCNTAASFFEVFFRKALPGCTLLTCRYRSSCVGPV